jgi:hypothetical protein
VPVGVSHLSAWEMAKALKVVEFYCWRGKSWTSNDQAPLTEDIKGDFADVDFRFFKICKPVKDLYLCHCCPRQCQKEKKSCILS